MTIGSCRALFRLNDAKAPVRAFVLNLGDSSEQTGIRSISTESGNQGMADAWYDLSGRKLSSKPTRKGLYIHGGNKVVIK